MLSDAHTFLKKHYFNLCAAAKRKKNNPHTARNVLFLGMARRSYAIIFSSCSVAPLNDNIPVFSFILRMQVVVEPDGGERNALYASLLLLPSVYPTDESERHTQQAG